MKENDKFILDIKRLGINGEGIGFYNKMAVFVDKAIPGEGHDVIVEQVNGNMAFAKSVEVKTPSPNRAFPSCKHYFNCGRCNVSHIKYEYALKLKRDLIIEALNRYTKLNYKAFEIKEVETVDSNFNYRYFADVMIRKNAEGVKACLQNGSIPIEDCLVLKNQIKTIVKQIVSLIEKQGISVYLPKFKRGIIKGLKIGLNKSNEALIVFLCNEKSNKIIELAKETINIDNVVGVYEEYEDGSLNHLAGEEYLVEQYQKTKYNLNPKSYFLDNTKKFELVLKACKLARKENVLCNSIDLSLFIASMTKKMTAVEYDKQLVNQGVELAKLNRLDNLKVIQGDLTNLISKLFNSEYYDVLVLDAKRYSLDNKLLDEILKNNVKRIVYICFNPSAMARDIEKLSSKYQVKYIASIDQEPQTAIVESIVLLEKK